MMLATIFMFHLEHNVITKFRTNADGRAQKAVKATTEEDLAIALTYIRNRNEQIYDYLMNTEPKT
jgi:hypothetical protein